MRYARYLSKDGSRWIRHGLFRSYFPDGAVSSEGLYEHGSEHGMWRTYHENGQLASEGNYIQGIEAEDWKFWSSDGTPES